MKLTRDDRTLTAWMLYASVLFSLFVCGIHHGQMSGLALSGLNAGYCSVSSDSGAGTNLGDSDRTATVIAQLGCPLCSSFSLAVAINTTGWVLDYVPAVFTGSFARSWAQPPPRYSWPSLNPRASPPSFFS